MTLFEWQLLISFFVGGSFVAFLTLFTEKLPRHLAGLILGMPSVVAIGLFFMAWTISPEEVARIIPATLVPLGLAALFPCFYIPVAQKLESTRFSCFSKILMSLFVATIIWCIFAIPYAWYEINTLWINMMVYVILVWAAYFYLHQQNPPKPKAISYSWSQKLGRGAFVGLLMVAILLGGKYGGPFWAGLITIFPIVGASSLIIFHYYYSPQALIPAFQKYPLGNISICVYVLVVMETFPRIGFVYGTIAAFFVSFIALFLLSKVAKI